MYHYFLKKIIAAVDSERISVIIPFSTFMTNWTHSIDLKYPEIVRGKLLMIGGSMNKYRFVEYEPVRSIDGRFIIGQEDHQMLRSRRKQLGLTQQQVADRAKIQLKQYQRLETGERHLSGCSMRIGLAVCAVLLLNPYECVAVTAKQPDPSTMGPQHRVDLKVDET